MGWKPEWEGAEEMEEKLGRWWAVWTAAKKPEERAGAEREGQGQRGRGRG